MERVVPVAYPEAYLSYLVYFHGVRDYFECHEVLEEEWKKHPRGERQSYWQGLIQIAVALYHWRRGNLVGAERSVLNAIANLEGERTHLRELALDYPQVMAQLQELLSKVKNGHPYESINLPITDASLIEKCEKRCREKGCTMFNPSDMTDTNLIHKHQMPNRDQVISKREAKKYRNR